MVNGDIYTSQNMVKRNSLGSSEYTIVMAIAYDLWSELKNRNVPN